MKKIIAIVLAFCLILPYTALAQHPLSVIDEDDDRIYHWSTNLLRFLATQNNTDNSTRESVEGLPGIESVTYEYYPSGNLKSMTLSEPDADGNIKYEYYDEDFYGDQTGRYLKITRADGSYDVFVEYWTGTDQVKIKEEYASDGTLVCTHEYDISGKLIRTTYEWAIDQLTDNSNNDGFSQINADGYVVWAGYDGIDDEIFLYDGTSVTQITNNSYLDAYPQINDNGYAAWFGNDGTDREIFLYDGTSVIQLTNNAYDDEDTQINNDGYVVWDGWDGTDWEIFLYDGTSVTQITNRSDNDIYPEINDNGYIVWAGSDGTDWEIFLYDGSSVTQLTYNSYNDLYPQINGNGYAVWAVWYGWDGTDWEIFLYDGSSVTQLTNNAYDDGSPQINDNGEVVWYGWDGADWEIFLYDGSTTTQITNNAYDDGNPQINDNGYVVWYGDDGTDYEIFLYDGSSVTQLTNNSYDDIYPQINENGYTVWYGWDGIDYEISLATPPLTIDYGYYTSDMLKFKTLSRPDENGIIYYHYIDEDFGGQGYGRVDKEILAEADTDGAMGYIYTYHTGTDIVQTSECYETANYSDPSNPILTNLLMTYEYDISGNLIKKTLPDGTVYTYYIGTGFYESLTPPVPDVNGNVYYHYINEDFGGQGYGRIDKQVLDQPDADGAIAYIYTYHTGTDIVQTSECYETANYSDPSNPILTNLLMTYEYDISGNLIKKTLPDGTIYEYDTSGNLIKKTLPDGTIYTYYVDTGLYESVTLPAPDGNNNIYYEYYNENFANGLGRTYITEALDGTLTYNYGFNYGTTLDLVGYRTDAWPSFGNAKAFFYYTNDLADIISKRFEFDNGDIAEVNFLSATEMQLTQFGYSSGRTLWFLWGTNVYQGYDNVVIEQAGGDISVDTTVTAEDTPLYIAITPDGNYAYVANFAPGVEAGTVSVINTSTNAVEATITVGKQPYHIAITPNGRHAYVTNCSSENSVSVIDLSTNTVIATIGVGKDPHYIAITLDGNYAYVTNLNSGTVSVIDTSNNTVVQTIDVGTSPRHIAITPDGIYAYVANTISNTVSVINISSNSVETTINVGNTPTYIAFTPDGNYAYVANTVSDTVSVIDVSTNSFVTDINVGNGPSHIAITPDGSYAYVVNCSGDNSVSVINISTNTVETTISVGADPHHIAIAPDGSYAYVANNSTNNVSVINISTNTVETTLDVGTNPQYIAITPDGSYVYVANITSDNVTKIIAGEIWNAYWGFTPDMQNPENVLDDTVWGGNLIGPIADPESLVLPELGDWWQYCLNSNIIPEFPPVSSQYFDDDTDDKTDRRIDQNDILDTTYNYTWDYLVAGEMKVDMLYDYDNDSTDDFVYSRVYKNDTDYDISNINTWQLLSETYVTTGLEITYGYYASGMRESKVCSQPDAFGNVYYHYIDEDFASQGYGRIDKEVLDQPDADNAIAYEYIYDGDTGTILEKRCYEDAFISGANPADLNDDGMVNMLDYGLFSNEWGWTGTPGENTCDFNSDGIVNERDLDIFNAFWLMSQDPSPSDPIFANLVRTYTYYAESASRLESMTLRDPDEEGNIYYEYENNDFYGNGEHGRIIRTQRASDGHVIRTLSWVGNTDKVLKEEEFTDLTETEWLETRWYYKETGRIRARRENDGSVILYHDTDGDKKYIYWAPDGSISCWKTADDYDNDKKAWYMKDGLLEVYTYYDSGRVQFKDIYEVIDGMLTWKEAYGYLDSGDFSFGDFDSMKTIEETGADLYYSIHNKPWRSDSDILYLLSGETRFNHEEEARMALESLLNQTYSEGSGYTFSPHLAGQTESKYKN